MHSDKWSPVASLAAGLCLLEVEPAVSALRFVGLGFLLDFTVLVVVFLALTGIFLWTLARDRPYHRDPWPGRLAWAGLAGVLAGVWVAAPVGWAGLALLAGAAIRNQLLVARLSERRRRARETNRRSG